jgi:hypothetical protein
LLTEFFPPIESARQESNRAHGFLALINNTTDEFGAGFTTGWSGEGSLQEKKRKPVVAEMKARQAAKIRELGHALVDSGFMTLDEQSKALGLARSTTWTILRASHKGSGLSAAIIKRMLLSPQLPPLARRKILDYTTDKLAGVYGGSRRRRLKFFERMKLATPENNERPAAADAQAARGEMILIAP